MSNLKTTAKPGFWGLMLFILFFSLGLAGCLEAYVDAGPNPARVLVQVNGVVTKPEINDALQRHGEFGVPLVAGQFRTTYGPFWTWQLLYIKDENNLRDLRTVYQTPRRRIEGYNLSGREEFLLPPGRHRVRLLTQVMMEIEFRESWFEDAYEPVEVATYSEDFDLDLKPGETFSITRSYPKP